MRRIILVLSMLTIGKCYCQTTWQKSFDFLQDVDYFNSLIVTTDTGYLIAGYASEGGGTERNLLIVKTDSLGDTTWSKTMSANENIIANSIIQRPDGGHAIVGSYGIFGSQTHDVYIARLTSTGDTLWMRLIGGPNEESGNSLVPTMDGGFIFVGSTTSFGAGDKDMYAVKIDSSGDTSWTKTFGGLDADFATFVSKISDSAYIMAGNTSSFNSSQDIFLVKVNEYGDTIWSKCYDGVNSDGSTCIQKTHDNGFIICGSTNSFGAGNYDAHLLKIDSGGNVQWSKTYGGSDEDAAVYVIQCIDKGFAVVGYTKSFGGGGYDVYAFKTDSTGNIMWSKAYGGPQWEFGNCIKQTIDGFAIVGNSASFAQFLYDGYFIKTDFNGNSGCYETNIPTIVNNAFWVASNPGCTVSNGGIFFNPHYTLHGGSTINILCSSVSINNSGLSSSEFSIFPNPTKHMIHVMIRPDVDSGFISVRNMLGEIIYMSEIHNENLVTLDINLVNGVYFVSIETEKYRFVQKLVVRN